MKLFMDSFYMTVFLFFVFVTYKTPSTIKGRLYWSYGYFCYTWSKLLFRQNLCYCSGFSLLQKLTEMFYLYIFIELFYHIKVLSVKCWCFGLNMHMFYKLW